ncbi:MAG: hypothetical protein HYS25_02770 [Ignavibacteriales bacterium]|nr:hypothetical protein [Ignavibacteriales bacterium]
MKRIIAFVILSFFISNSFLFSQTEKHDLAGKHTLFFESGFKTNSKTSVVTNPAVVETKTGFIGNFGYGYWFEDEWALTITAGVFGAESTTKYNGVESNAIVPILFGVKYYPAKFALSSAGRFYAGLALGAYMGFATKTETLGGTTTVSESVIGAQASIGLDIFPASWFRIGPKLSYHLLGDYEEIIGTKKNLSGGSFSVDFGFVF